MGDQPFRHALDGAVHRKEIGKTDGYYDYGAPSWLGSDRALTTSYGPYNAQGLLTKVGDETRGTDFSAFDSLGAVPSSDRARSELEATGETARPREA